MPHAQNLVSLTFAVLPDHTKPVPFANGSALTAVIADKTSVSSSEGVTVSFFFVKGMIESSLERCAGADV